MSDDLSGDMLAPSWPNLIGPRVLGWQNQPIGNHGLGIFWCGQIAKLKSAYNSLIIGCTGLGW